MKYIDISFPIDSNIAIYPGNPVFSIERIQSLEKGGSSNVTKICIGSHTGTHIDAPIHLIQGGATLDDIPLESINGLARVIDATGLPEIDMAFLSSIKLEQNSIVLFRTDNTSVWACDRILDEYVTLSYDAADYLARIKVKLVGIDYLTIERPRSCRIPGKSVHKSLLGSGTLICEGLSLNNVSAGEYEFLCMPLRISGLDGCPVRCVLKYI